MEEVVPVEDTKEEDKRKAIQMYCFFCLNKYHTFMKIINKNKLKSFLNRVDLKDTIFVLDFDGTITLEGVNSFSAINYKSEWMTKYIEKLFHYYWPIERASNFEQIQDFLQQNDLLLSQSGISFESFRDIMMQQWWDVTMNIAVKFEIDFNSFDVAKMQMREGMKDFLQILIKKDLSLLIASAWVQNFIEPFFIHHNFDVKKLHIVANEFLVDSKWNAIWYNKELITPFTKQHIDYTKYNLLEKKYAIQIWDSLWDAHIVNDHFEEQNLLSIWFSHWDLNRQESFEKAFDIVFDIKDEEIGGLMELLDL